MAAHEALGRQFLDRHLVEHHGWQENWLGDYDELQPGEPHSDVNQALSVEHDMTHATYAEHGWPSPTAYGENGTERVVPHTHSPERIHFH